MAQRAAEMPVSGGSKSQLVNALPPPMPLCCIAATFQWNRRNEIVASANWERTRNQVHPGCVNRKIIAVGRTQSGRLPLLNPAAIAPPSLRDASNKEFHVRFH